MVSKSHPLKNEIESRVVCSGTREENEFLGFCQCACVVVGLVMNVLQVNIEEGNITREEKD